MLIFNHICTTKYIYIQDIVKKIKKKRVIYFRNKHGSYRIFY